MNETEAENLIYASYVRAEGHLDRNAPDALKRHPELSRELIRRFSGTPCAVVTGSKGKGSVAEMIAAVLGTQSDVGLMTSPHVSVFRERFRVNGEMISSAEFERHMDALAPAIEEITSALPENVFLSPVGIQTSLALRWFGERKTAFNVLECGKGAQYDDVNNVPHDYAVINGIFAEHTRELGATVRDIARDKAHVITGEQKCVYSAPQAEEALEEIKKRAAEKGVRLRLYGEDFSAEHIRFTENGMLFDFESPVFSLKDIRIPLLGEHQARNCALALALCADVLPAPDEVKIKEALARIERPGRTELLSSRPFILLDACIHAESCKEVKQVLSRLGIEKAAVVIGIPDDKDYAGVAREMRDIAGLTVLTRSQNVHYVFTEKQKDVLAGMGISAEWTDNVNDALSVALKSGLPVVILGTTSVVAEVKGLQHDGHLTDDIKE